MCAKSPLQQTHRDALRRCRRPPPRRLTATLRAGCLVMLGSCCVTLSTAGATKRIRTQIANYDKTPVSLTGAWVRLRESFSPPNQVPMSALQGVPKSKPTRGGVRYLNRLAQQIPIYKLEGELEVCNTTPKRVDLVQVTAVYFDAFRTRLGDARQIIQQPLGPSQRTRLSWSGELPHEDVFEMFFVVTGVRFEDDATWTAPEEELILEP